jgi:hypothetical protein
MNPELQLIKLGVFPFRNRIPNSKRTSITPDQLNLQEGLSGTFTNPFIEYINRKDM